MATEDIVLRTVIDDMSAQLEAARGRRPADAPELERQICACFLYGMISAHVFEHKLPPEDMVTGVTYMLESVLGYDETQAEKFLETFLGAGAGAVTSLIGSGISGYYAYAAGNSAELSSVFNELLKSVYLKQE